MKISTLCLSGLAIVMVGCSSWCESSCKSSETSCKLQAQTTPLLETVWVLDNATVPGQDMSWEKPMSEVTLRLDKEGRVSGCAGVNRYMGQYKLDTREQEISFGDNFGCTMMAGPGLQFEGNYLKQLSEVDDYKLENGKLTLLDDEKVIAVYTPAPAEAEVK